jgi:hypothetical protein
VGTFDTRGKFDCLVTIRWSYRAVRFVDRRQVAHPVRRMDRTSPTPSVPRVTAVRASNLCAAWAISRIGGRAG